MIVECWPIDVPQQSRIGFKPKGNGGKTHTWINRVKHIVIVKPKLRDNRKSWHLRCLHQGFLVQQEQLRILRTIHNTACIYCSSADEWEGSCCSPLFVSITILNFACSIVPRQLAERRFCNAENLDHYFISTWLLTNRALVSASDNRCAPRLGEWDMVADSGS